MIVNNKEALVALRRLVDSLESGKALGAEDRAALVDTSAEVTEYLAKCHRMRLAFEEKQAAK